MRVLQFRSLCDTGGVSTSMLLLGQQLASRGIACEYWFFEASNRLSEFEAQGKTTRANLAQLALRLNRGDVDIVQMTASDPAAEVVARIARGKARVVVTARGALSTIWNAHTCFAYTAISKGMAEVNQPYTDIAIDVVRNSIDLSRFATGKPSEAATHGAPIVAFVGRTNSDEKDFPRFTRIAAQLLKRSDVRVWIADPHESSWEKFQRPDVVQIPAERWSRVSSADIPDFYRNVAASNGIVIMTSRTEGFGNVAPEAAACGARVAAPDVMGLREAIVDGVTGRLFPADASDESVANMAYDWMQSPHDSESVAQAARREFSPTVMMDAYAKIYDRTEPRLLAGARPKPARTAEMPLLLDHLQRSREWRSTYSWNGARDLADAGLGADTRKAMWLAFRTTPLRFFNPTSARHFVKMSRSIVGSMLRGMRATAATN